jgi:hypothetical protein
VEQELKLQHLVVGEDMVEVLEILQSNRILWNGTSWTSKWRKLSYSYKKINVRSTGTQTAALSFWW